jgi:hypothetical protein
MELELEKNNSVLAFGHSEDRKHIQFVVLGCRSVDVLGTLLVLLAKDVDICVEASTLVAQSLVIAVKAIKFSLYVVGFILGERWVTSRAR